MSANHRCLTLVGMPGVGKSFLGRRAARRLGWRFIDLDDALTAKHGPALQALLDRLGPAGFVELEAAEALACRGDEPAVIAPGGSVIYSDQAMAHLRAISTVAYLRDDLARIAARIDNLEQRAIVGLAEHGLQGLLARREALYLRHAHLVHDLSPGLPPEDEVSRLLDECGGSVCLDEK